MRARPARDRAGLRGRRGYPAWRRHVRVNSAPLCARPCAGHMRYADSNHLRNSPRRQEVSPLFLCEDSVAGRGGGFPVSPIHPTTQPESEPRAELTLTCTPSWPAAASLSRHPPPGAPCPFPQPSLQVKGQPLCDAPASWSHLPHRRSCPKDALPHPAWTFPRDPGGQGRAGAVAALRPPTGSGVAWSH